jgi:antitoxin (DNA-binding transcriptional repressor) of toxin-antitoxin stability system
MVKSIDHMERTMAATRSISASEFKATCLDILKQLDERKLERVVITRRGHAVAVLTPPRSDAEAVRSIHGFMRGSVTIPADLDLTAPILDEAFDAEEGVLHR